MKFITVLVIFACIATAAFAQTRQQAQLYFESGWDAYLRNDYDKAIADLTQMVLLTPDLAFSYIVRGIVYNEKGDHDKAIADLTQAIKINPYDKRAYLVRGCVYYEKKNYDKAIADFEAGLRLDPDDAELKSNLELARKRGR